MKLGDMICQSAVVRGIISFTSMNFQDNPDDDGVNRRLQRNTLLFFGLAVIAGLVRGSWRLTAGIALGGALSLFNKRWLEGSIRALLRQAGTMPDGRVPSWPASKLILRYFVLALCFGTAILTGAFHPLGLAIGFASFVGGVMIEAGYQLYLALKSDPGTGTNTGE